MERQRMMRTKRRWIISILIVSFVLALSGCLVVGQTVPVEKRVPLVSDGVQKGRWESGGLTVTYTYRLDQKASDAGGLLDIEGSVQYGFGRTDSLDVRIDFLDSNGKILQRKILFSSEFKKAFYGTNEGSFHEKLETPAATTGISFFCIAIPFPGRQ